MAQEKVEKIATTASREIESKFEVVRATVDSMNEIVTSVHRVLEELGELPNTRFMDSCQTEDTYFKVPAESGMQIIRTRDSIGRMANGEYHILKEITLKAKDRGHNKNRYEKNLSVESIAGAKEVLMQLTGAAPIGAITKPAEAIWFIGHRPSETVISVCAIKNDGKVYLEVEAPSSAEVRRYVDAIKDSVPLKPITKSFFELFVEPNGK